MKLGIVGLEKSGKTTVFNALTGAGAETGSFGRIEAHIAAVKVPDARIDWLAKLYNPEKTVHARIDFVDIPGSINDTSDPKIVASCREQDAFSFVIRAFDNPGVPIGPNGINPARDFDEVNLGLVLSDLAVAGKRLEKIEKLAAKGAAGTAEKEELTILKKVMETLEMEKPLSGSGLDENEKKLLRPFGFLTLKPCLTLINVSDNMLKSSETSGYLKRLPNAMAICANIETEIQKLDEADREVFLKDLGLEEPSLNIFIRKAFETLGLISFFTVGEDEVRAWTIPKETKAVTAAGSIHSDLERGFIRAEVVSYEDLRSAGSIQEAKKRGLLRLEGKDYTVKDGDIMHVKFNV